jgi:hypothetical protein
MYIIGSHFTILCIVPTCNWCTLHGCRTQEGNEMTKMKHPIDHYFNLLSTFIKPLRLSHLFSTFLIFKCSYYVVRLSSPNLLYFAKWQYFLEKTSCTLKNTSFSISSKLFYQISKICCKKIHGYLPTYKLLASRLLLTCCYNKLWFFLLQCVPSYNDVKLLQTPHIYVKLEMRSHIYLTLVMSQIFFITTRKTIFPL